MWKLLVMSLVVTCLMETEGSQSSGGSSRYYRQNLYNYRPQSTLIDDEQEYRSYDNNFGHFRGGSSSSYRSPRPPPPLPPPRIPLPQLSNSRNRPYIHHDPPNNFQDDDDYSNDSDLRDDDDVDLDHNPRYNFRPSGSSRPASPLPPLSQWNDISGPERGDASYSFGYDLHDQSRHEHADPYGNVNGDFSFVDDEGTFRRVSYTAGAHKGFVVKQKQPGDGPSPLSPHRRPSSSFIKKQPILIPESPRPSPRLPTSSPVPQQQVQQSTDQESSPSPVPANKGSNSSGSRVSSSNSGSRDIVGANGGSLSSGKPWGALGQSHQIGRPRNRKRKPALVVKVKRPAQHQPPAWMYYRPPMPGKPLADGSNTGWQQQPQKKPTLPPPPASYQDELDNGQWSEAENDISDAYPKDKSYSFGYNTGDQTRQEVSDAWGNIRGSYSYLDPSGVTRTVHYTAGHSGFKILNAQPSILRPVYTEAPPVQSIPIPIAVSHQIHPQPSAIVYHIHPDGGVGADWKPWESTRTKSHNYQRRRRNRPRSQQQILQPNSFHLTHSNHRFFPAYSNIYDQTPAHSSNPHEVDAETLPTITRHRIENDPQFLKHIQQQIKRSNKLYKLKRLQQQYKQQQEQQVFMYTRNRSPSNRQRPQQQQLQQNRVPDSRAEEETLTALEDQHFSDYEAAQAIVQSNPVLLQRRLDKKNQKSQNQKKASSPGSQSQNQLVQQQEQQKEDSPRNEEINNSANNDSHHSSSNFVDLDNADSIITEPADPTVNPTFVSTVKQIDVESDDHDIHPYNGGFGEKTPVMMMSQRDSSPVMSLRQQRKISMDSRAVASQEKSTSVPDNLVAESMLSSSVALERPMPMDTLQMTSPTPTDMEKVLMRREHSMETRKERITATTSTERKTSRSPAALLVAKMASAPVPKMTSISAITIPGRTMHYPSGKEEPMYSKENDHPN